MVTAVLGGCAQAPALVSAKSTGPCQLSGGGVIEGFSISRPLGKGAATPELAVAEYVASNPVQAIPADGWVRQTPSLFNGGQRMVHMGGQWEVDVARDEDGTWGIDGGRHCR